VGGYCKARRARRLWDSLLLPEARTARQREEVGGRARGTSWWSERHLVAFAWAGGIWPSARPVCAMRGRMRAVYDGARNRACVPSDAWPWPSRQGRGKVGMFLLAAVHTPRASSNAAAAGRAIRREAGAAKRATRLPGESQGGGGVSGCELTPSHVLG
jgi:hypothetical protein